MEVIWRLRASTILCFLNGAEQEPETPVFPFNKGRPPPRAGGGAERGGRHGTADACPGKGCIKKGLNGHPREFFCHVLHFVMACDPRSPREIEEELPQKGKAQ